MLVINDPAFYLTAVPAVLIYGIGKGGFGGALGLIAVPLMALTIPPSQAAAILLPILCVMDIFAVKQHYSNADYQVLRRMFPGAIFGIIVAGLMLSIISSADLKIFIGGLSLAFYFQSQLKPATGQQKPGLVKAWLWSSLTGVSSTAIHAGGGPASVYLLPLRMEKVTLVATMAVLFAAINLVKLVPYTLLGEFDNTNLLTALMLIPLAPVGVYIGVWLLHRISQQSVYRLCYLFLLVSGGKLLVDGLSVYIS